jgi:hypothetical protein
MAILINRDGVDPRDYGGISYDEWVPFIFLADPGTNAIVGNWRKRPNNTSDKRMKADSDAKYVRNSSKRHIM